ncbi:MAG: hypothetical protein IPJ16_02115 [Bacteroidales bacterium]|nr:hypothetical protein [Bacteroidales bacterium]
MKNLLQSLSGTLLILCLTVNSVSAQEKKQTGQIDRTEFSLHKSISFNGENEKIEILIQVTESNNVLKLMISSIVFSGELTIEVFDPTGEEQGKYSVGSQNSLKTTGKTNNPTQNETVSGKISKLVESPIKGDWKIIVIPKNVKGSLNIDSDQSSIKK